MNKRLLSSLSRHSARVDHEPDLNLYKKRFPTAPALPRPEPATVIPRVGASPLRVVWTLPVKSWPD